MCGEDSYLDAHYESQTEYLDYHMEQAEMNAREAADYDHEGDYEDEEDYEEPEIDMCDITFGGD